MTNNAHTFANGQTFTPGETVTVHFPRTGAEEVTLLDLYPVVRFQDRNGHVSEVWGSHFLDMLKPQARNPHLITEYRRGN